MEKQKNVPVLRFPEFTGEWKRQKLGDVTDKITDGTHDTPKPTLEGVPFLTAIHIKDGEIDYKNCYFLPKEVHAQIYKRCNPEKGDLLLVNIGAGTATCSTNIADYEFSLKNVALIKPNKTIIDPYYLGQFQRNKSGKIFNQLTSGGAQPFLSLKEIGKLEISFPSLPEQTKIANFLTTIDTKIQQLTQKKTLLEEYKKGVMQQLFSQKIRFKDENREDYPNWEEQPIGIGLAESRIIGLKGNEAKKLTVKLWGKGVYEKKEVTEGSENTQYYYRKAGQFIYSKLDFLNCAFGIIPKELDRFQSTLDLPTFDINQSIFNPVFLLARITQKDFYKKNGDTADGSRKAKRIHSEDFLTFYINVPSIEEQTKIANFLTTIDAKIETVAKQVEQTQAYKKGLLQQLFI